MNHKQNVKRWGSVAAIALAGSLVLSSCASNEENAAAETTEGLAGTLVGGGASSQGSAQEAWIAAFQTDNPNVTIEYDPSGSGTGRETFIAGASTFAGSDRAFTDQELTESNFVPCVPGTDIVEVPAYISPIAVIFNLEGIDTLNLDAAAIAGIFSGTITTWDDDAIASQNPDADLPATTITAVHRSDDSGTTENFTDYLNVVAPDAWPYEAAGVWPVEGGEAAQGTSGVVDAVKSGTGTIGYADASRATGLGTVAVKVGDEYVSYSAEAAAAIVDASPLATGRSDVDLAIELDRASAAEGVYPVVLVSYLIACSEYEDAEAGALAKAYLNYVISAEGQATAADAAGIAPISSTLYQKAQAAVDAIT